jgi:PAS domain S-box-containing protein
MKNKITPSTVEKVMREKDLIFSRTDLKGKITYANNIFIEFSGYTQEELIGEQHNIIRHPDMPRAIFKILWDKIQNKEECCAYVKNMSKDGSYYWVFATVSPAFDEAGNPKGYTSWREKPKQRGLEAAKSLYATMLEAEKKAGPENAISASTKILTELLDEKGMSYDEFVKAI